MGKYGDIRRYDPPRESVVGLVAITVLTLIELLLLVVFVWGVATGNVTNTASNMFLGGVLGFIFIDLAFILMIYKVEFLPDMLVIKKRRKKYEDIWVAEEDVDGHSLRERLEDEFRKSASPYERKT
ncbi:MAG: hypothetical protein SV377_05630 [Halobacteria archaeon]|nr:hypothetical protein [Halobacteria archaeon]